MILQLVSQHCHIEPALNDLIKRKVDKLDTYYPRIVDGEVFVRQSHTHHDDDKIIEVKINVPGATLFTKHRSSSFEASTFFCVEHMRRKLRKLKGKQAQNR